MCRHKFLTSAGRLIVQICVTHRRETDEGFTTTVATAGVKLSLSL
jgi:hypothetical protein